MATTDPMPLVSVIVPAYNAESFLAQTLESVLAQTYRNLEVLVVDDGSVDRTAAIVRSFQQRDSRVCLLQQSNAGVAAARNRGISAARGVFIAPIDADDLWYPQNLEKQLACFQQSDSSLGLVYAWSIDIDQQSLPTGGFHAASATGNVFKTLICHNFLGNASSTVIRRTCLEAIGGYNPQFRAEQAQGCEDWDLYLRLAERYSFQVVPEFLIGYRKTASSLSSQFQTMARSHMLMLRTVQQNHPHLPAWLYRLSRSSLYIYFAHQSYRYGNAHQTLYWLAAAIKADRVTPFVRLGLYTLTVQSLWMLSGEIPQISPSSTHPPIYPSAHPPLPPPSPLSLRFKLLISGLLHRLLQTLLGSSDRDRALKPRSKAIPRQVPIGIPTAVRQVEWLSPLPALTDLQDYGITRIVVTRQNTLLGSLDIVNQQQPIESEALEAAIVARFGRSVLEQTVLPEPPLPLSIAVSIIVPTCDRPAELQRCLQQLVDQPIERSVEIIVVDNRPASGLTAPVVAQFPAVRLVSESRTGSSYARNAGIVQSQGDIVVTIDDDVIAPEGWLEKLIAPFARPEVMAVTGNILPIELETPAQQLFEIYGNGGLGRGFQRFEVNRDWLHQFWLAAPTWELGATANAAFRAEIFHHPQIGLMAEYLGAGVPAGGGEDIDLFYKVLQAGYTHVYQASAYVWHQHRRDRPALRHQIYSYSKGVVSYHLLTLWQHHDIRPLLTLLLFLPLYHLKQILWRLTGQSAYPLSLIGVEILGHLAAPWSLWRSYRSCLRQGHSRPYVPVASRASSPASESATDAPILSAANLSTAN